MTPLPLVELLGFVLGLLFGSFLNVCISRLPAHESIVKPRSHCMACGHEIRWYDNLPLLSWIVLRGRCRDCKATISWRYPAVELAVGVWFAAVGLQCMRASLVGLYVQLSGAQEATVALLGIDLAILGFLLIGLIVMDWQTQRLPDAFTLTGIGIGFLLTCVQAYFLAPGQGDIVIDTTHQLRLSSPGSFASQGNVFLTGTEALIMGRLAAIAGAALILLLVRWGYKALRKRDGMGLGDVKLLAMIAAFLGFWQTLLALFAAVLAASVYGILLIARRRASGNSKLPLGSFLAAGGLFAALFGARIVAWYAGLLR
ncbi:MAG TPA: prepilin peptidase [Acidobacteriaceae bacterium]|nr:prepilin peptidase [Acidobacteriaceae bacterium]